ncbi:MAG: hypothetical protein R6U21_06490 [Thermoplasmatota archaeon]
MKKIGIIILCLILMSVTLAGSQNIVQQTNNQLKETQNTSLLTNEDHTVFAEYATTTWCPNCPDASAALYGLYQSTTQPFVYVTLVSDKNENAKQRSWYGYQNVAIPSVYFDGGYQNFIGSAGSISATKNEYQHLLQESNNREKIKDISVQTSATWNGDAEISVQVHITNHESVPYIGILKTYITEIISRWNDYSQEPYHYGFLDFAINQPILLMPQKTKTLTAQWDGKEDHNGISFPDLLQNNTMIATSVSHIIPHYHKGYETSQFTQHYFGFYVDQADSCIPE